MGHLKLPIEDMQQIPNDSGSFATHSITMKRMMAKKVEPDTFKPLGHKLRDNIETKLEELLKEYKSQFTQDETTIGTTSLTKMTIDTGDSEPVSEEPYLIAMKHYKGRRHLFTTEWCRIFLNLRSRSRISPHPIGSVIYTQNSLHFIIQKI